MKKIMILACAAAMAAAVAPADEPAAGDSQVVAQTLFADGRTNTWTQADLIAALQLMNRKYHRDCNSPSGRNAWHGKLVAQSVDTNELVKTETYEDGTTFTFPFMEKTAVRPKTTLTSSGVPAALAAARQRREAEKATTNVVTVTVTAGGDR